MNRSAIKYLVIGILVGALVSGAFSAGAATTSKPKSKTHHTTKHHKKKAKKKKVKKSPVVAPTAGESMLGLFKINGGVFSSATGPGGSYIRLISPGGSLDKGPFFLNPSSKGGVYNLIQPGSDGGLITGSYQEPPAKPFSLTGDALASRIAFPQRFAGILFSLSTSQTDPQTHVQVPAPSVVNNNGVLSGQITAMSAEWNRAFFNQGSPKPDGTSPGLTTALHGTYDPTTKAYTLDWSSAVVGGPFNGFTGEWHLEGTFEASCTAPTTTPAPAATTPAPTTTAKAPA